MSSRYKQKKMLDQAAMDFISTIDHYRLQVPEVEIFHEFFKETNNESDLTLYLLLRAQAEKEFGFSLSKQPSGDVR